MYRTLTVLTIAGLLLIGASGAFAEEEADGPDSLQALAPDLYLDCDYCDEDYLHTEIGFVNFVRDRKQADVHVLVTSQRTGSGGTEYTLEFIGVDGLEGQADTLRFAVLESDSDDTIRKEMAKAIKLGMVRHVARTPLGRHLSIGYDRPTTTTEVKDKWNYWVFEISGNSWLNGEESYRSLNLWGDVSARRVTDASKTTLQVYGSYDESVFEYESDGEMVSTLSLSRSRGASGSWYRSIDEHWSAGLSVSGSSSTYSNRDLTVSGGPRVEFNIFPYSESTRRQLRFVYGLSPSHIDYTEETIFGKMDEWLVSQSLGVELELVQPWGSVESSLWGSHYFYDFKKNSLTWWNELSLRVFKGLSVNCNGTISRVRDQLSLPKGGATEEEILLRRRQLATDYEYWGSIGFSYSFGSIYNNVVNPRFGN